MPDDAAKEGGWSAIQNKVAAAVIAGLLSYAGYGEVKDSRQGERIDRLVADIGKLEEMVRAQKEIDRKQDARLDGADQRQTTLAQHVSQRGDELGRLLARLETRDEATRELLLRLERRLDRWESQPR